MNSFIHRFALASLCIIVITRSVDASESVWRQTNGPLGGLVGDIAINSSGYIFAGTMAGVFRSTDDGATWVVKNSGFPPAEGGGWNLWTTALAVDPNGHIWVAIYHHGVFRSTDNGDSWNAVTTGPENEYENIYRLVTNADGYIFAATTSGILRCRHSFSAESVPSGVEKSIITSSR